MPVAGDAEGGNGDVGAECFSPTRDLANAAAAATSLRETEAESGEAKEDEAETEVVEPPPCWCWCRLSAPPTPADEGVGWRGAAFGLR